MNYLCNIKTFSNEKIFHSTKCSFDKFFKKNQVYSLKNLKFNKSKKKPSLINLKSLSIKHENNVKKFFKTNIPLDDERIIFDKIQKKASKEKKLEKNVNFKSISNSSNNNIILKKKRIFKKLINYKVSEENKDEKNKEKSNNENDYGYLNLNSGSIWTKIKDYNYLPSIV